MWYLCFLFVFRYLSQRALNILGSITLLALFGSRNTRGFEVKSEAEV